MSLTRVPELPGPVIGRPFQPGQSGNPAGRPKGSGLRARIRELVGADGVDLVAVMLSIARDKRLVGVKGRALRLTACVELLKYGWGTPVGMDTTEGVPVTGVSFGGRYKPAGEFEAATPIPPRGPVAVPEPVQDERSEPEPSRGSVDGPAAVVPAEQLEAAPLRLPMPLGYAMKE